MGAIVSCVSNIMYLSEKITLYLTCTGLICCLIFTIAVTLGMGIGLGYNYCFVDMKTKFKYIKGHYIYPGSPRWPYSRQRDAVEEPALDEKSEDDELRRLPELEKITSIADDEDVLHDYVRNNNTDNGTAMNYHPTFPNSELFNGTESSVNTSVDAPTIDEVTEITENTTASTTKDEPEIIDETDEPTPEPFTVNEEQPESSPSSRKVKKLVIPISGLDLISLLTKLKAENRNYSLQIVTS